VCFRERNNILSVGAGWTNREGDTLGPYRILEDQVARGTMANANYTQVSGGYEVNGIAFKPAGGPPLQAILEPCKQGREGPPPPGTRIPPSILM
jgi:hypothetical protein